MPIISYISVTRKNFNGEEMIVRRMGTEDIDRVKKELERWGKGDVDVPEEIRNGAQKHFEHIFKSPFNDKSNLFLVSENPSNSSIYGVSDALTDDTQVAKIGYCVRLGEVRTGTILTSEVLKTLFSLTQIFEVQSEIVGGRGQDLAERFYFKIGPSVDWKNELVLKGILSRPDYEKLVKEHPGYFI